MVQEPEGFATFSRGTGWKLVDVGYDPAPSQGQAEGSSHTYGVIANLPAREPTVVDLGDPDDDEREFALIGQVQVRAGRVAEHRHPRAVLDEHFGGSLGFACGIDQPTANRDECTLTPPP